MKQTQISKSRCTTTSHKPTINLPPLCLTIGSHSSPKRVMARHLLNSLLEVTTFKTLRYLNDCQSWKMKRKSRANNYLKSKKKNLGKHYLSSLTMRLKTTASLKARPAQKGSVTGSHSSAFSQQRWSKLKITMKRTTMKSLI